MVGGDIISQSRSKRLDGRKLMNESKRTEDEMSQIQITINTDNAAFGDGAASEVARILRKLADRYDTNGLQVFTQLRDGNGNTIGEATFIG